MLVATGSNSVFRTRVPCPYLVWDLVRAVLARAQHTAQQRVVRALGYATGGLVGGCGSPVRPWSHHLGCAEPYRRGKGQVHSSSGTFGMASVPATGATAYVSEHVHRRPVLKAHTSPHIWPSHASRHLRPHAQDTECTPIVSAVRPTLELITQAHTGAMHHPPT